MDFFATPTPAPTRLTITARSGSIVVRSGDGAGIDVRGAKSRVEPDGSTRVESRSGDVEVTCPVGTDVILGTSSGKVRLEGRLGDVRITGSSGKVRVEAFAVSICGSGRGRSRSSRVRATATSSP
jgi:hypothetical protein